MNAAIQYDALIMSYLDGLCSPEEAVSLLSWVADSKEHQSYFESFKKVWELTAFPMPETIDVESALNSVNQSIELSESKSTAKVVEMPWLSRNVRYVASAAAAIVVALVFGFLVSKPMGNVTLASADWDSEVPYVLPDGSSVTFTGDAIIKHPKQFAKGEREVKFEGKALFDVAKDEQRPFVIHCDGLDVEVLGTSFLLNAPLESDKFILDLYNGKVRMTAIDEQGNVLSEQEILPEQRGVFASGQLMTMTYAEVKEEELLADHVLDFNDVSLNTIVEALEHIFNIHIDLAAEHANDKLTARFTDQDSVEEVLETIATVFDMKVTKSDNVYVIR